MANKVIRLKDGNDVLLPYADACGMDTSNVLYNAGYRDYSFSYTATEDCFGLFRTGVGASLDGITIVCPYYMSYGSIFLKKGQVLYLVGSGSGGGAWLKVFGIKR